MPWEFAAGGCDHGLHEVTASATRAGAILLTYDGHFGAVSRLAVLQLAPGAAARTTQEVIAECGQPPAPVPTSVSTPSTAGAFGANRWVRMNSIHTVRR